jgi:hypothetical protein
VKIRRNAGDTMSLSFLDVLTCGMGACVLLFLSLSAVRNHPGRSPYVDDFIQAQWHIDSRQAVLAFRITLHPDQGRDQTRVIGDQSDGKLNGRLSTPQSSDLAQSIFVFGRSSRTAVQRVEGPQAKGEAVLALHLHNPLAGCWTIEPIVVDFTDLYERALEGSDSPKAQFVTGWLATRNGVQQRLGAPQTVGLGEGIKWDNPAATTCAVRINRKQDKTN